MNLVHKGAAAAVGIASAAADNARMAPVSVGGQNVGISTIVELLAVVAGGVAQQFSPYMAPTAVDGIISGGLALVARRGTAHVLAQTASPMFAQRIGGQYVAPSLMGGYGAYGQIGSVSGVPRRKLV
jgi:hypothetical protein